MQLIYPEHIKNEENRKVYIYVIESPSLANSITDAVAKAKNFMSGLDSTKISENSLENTITNLNHSSDRRNPGRTVFTIVLPLPNEFTDTIAHDWESTKGIGGTVLGGIESQSIQSATGPLGDAIGRVADKIPVIGAGISAGMGMQVQEAIGAISNQLGVRKPLADPGYFQNYTGTKPREFNMSWDLIPNSPEEAKTIIHIILKLKEFSSASLTSSGISLLAPNYFDIEIGNKYISGLAQMKGVVINSMEIRFGADGNMQMFKDGIIKHINLTLSFSERSVKYSGQYRKQRL